MFRDLFLFADYSFMRQSWREDFAIMTSIIIIDSVQYRVRILVAHYTELNPSELVLNGYRFKPTDVVEQLLSTKTRNLCQTLDKQ